MQLLDENQQIIAIAGRDRVSEMQSFVDRHDLGDMVTIADESGEVWERFGVFGQPTWAFIDGETGESSVSFGGLGQEGVLATFANNGFN